MTNITFESVVINNFLSFGQETVVELNDQGFVIVKGSNQEYVTKGRSNGSGKSSIFDAIFWTITGETLRGASDVVNEKVGKDCYCTLSFKTDDCDYVITRYRSHSIYGNACYFYVNGELVSDQIKKSQEMISKAIPTMTSDVIGSIVLLGQGLPYKFSSLSPTKRKDLLETLSGSSSQIDKLKYQLDVESSKYTQEHSEIQNRINSSSAEISAQESLITSLKTQQKVTPQEVENQIRSIESQRQTAEQEIATITPQVESRQAESVQLTDMLNSTQNYLATITSNLQLSSQNLEQVSKGECPTCKRAYDDIEERRRLQEVYRNEINQYQTVLSSLGTKRASLSSRLNTLSEEIRNLEGRKISLNYSINSFDHEVSTLKRDLESYSKLAEDISASESRVKELRVLSYDDNEKLQEVTAYLDAISYLKRQVSRDFKGYVLKEAVEFLSSQTNKYSTYLFEDKKISVTLSSTKINISLDGRPYENLSGGERQRVDLSVQFALRDLLSISLGFSCNILVLDEAFDSLDSSGSESLINLVVSEFSEVNSVFTITHHTDISIPYDKTLLVTKNNEGISSISEVQ